MMERADFSLMASDDEKAAAARLALTVREVEKHLSLPERRRPQQPRERPQ